MSAGCERLIVHAESVTHLHRTLGYVRSLGATAGVALSPATPAVACSEVLDLVDLVLVMTVNPGFGGQDYLLSMEDKIARIRAMVEASGRAIEIEVDGGISAETIGGAARAGANVFVAGTALYRHPEGLSAAVSELRGKAEAAFRRLTAGAGLPRPTPCVPSTLVALDLLTVPYGAAAVDALADEVARAKAGEPLRPVTVVVPSNYAGVATRRALARRSGVAGLTVVTLYRLAELLAGPALARSGRVPVSSPVVSTAVRAALAEEPGLFGPVADQPSTVEALRRAHRELRDLGPEERALLGQDARSAAVLAIDARVTALLQEQWFDETDLMAAAAAAVGRDAADVGPLVVFLPQDVTSHGALLLRALAEHGQVTVLLGGTGAASGPGVRIAERLGAPLPTAAALPEFRWAAAPQPGAGGRGRRGR